MAKVTDMTIPDHHDPWNPGKRGFRRGLMWTAVILLVVWVLWG